MVGLLYLSSSSQVYARGAGGHCNPSRPFVHSLGPHMSRAYSNLLFDQQANIVKHEPQMLFTYEIDPLLDAKIDNERTGFLSLCGSGRSFFIWV